MIEYSALIYKNQKNNVYMANCFTKNLSGFGKTEEEALNNLKLTMLTTHNQKEIYLRPIYGLLA